MDGIPAISRRTALTAAATGGCAFLLAACSSGAKSDDPTVATTAATSPATTAASTSAASSSAESSAASSAAASSAASSSAATSASSSAPAANVLAKLSDIPVGGAISVKDGAVLLSQPTAGTVEGFNATCPHMGTLVEPAGTLFECPNHHSRFTYADGGLINGPATRGLTKIDVSVDGANVVQA